MRPSSIQTDWLSSSAFSLDWSVSVSARPFHHSLSKQSEITWTAPLQHSSSSLSKICLLSSQENPVYVPIKCFNLARKYLTSHNVILLKTCIFLVCVSVFSKVHTDLLSATRTRLSSPDDVTKLSNQLVPSPLSVCDLTLTALSLVEREWIRPELKHISSSGSESNEAQSRCERGREREVYSQFTAGNYWHCDINSSVIFSRPSEDDQKRHDPNKHTVN